MASFDGNGSDRDEGGQKEQSVLQVVDDEPEDSIAEIEIESEDEEDEKAGGRRSSARQSKRDVDERSFDEEEVFYDEAQTEEEALQPEDSFQDKNTPILHCTKPGMRQPIKDANHVMGNSLSTICEETTLTRGELEHNETEFSRCKAGKGKEYGTEKSEQDNMRKDESFVSGEAALQRVLDWQQEYENSPRSKFCEKDLRFVDQQALLRAPKEHSWEPSFHTPPRPGTHSRSPLDPNAPVFAPAPVHADGEISRDGVKLALRLSDNELPLQSHLQVKAKNPVLERVRSDVPTPSHTPQQPQPVADVSLASAAFSTSLSNSPDDFFASTPKGHASSSRLPRAGLEWDISRIRSPGQTDAKPQSTASSNSSVPAPVFTSSRPSSAPSPPFCTPVSINLSTSNTTGIGMISAEDIQRIQLESRNDPSKNFMALLEEHRQKLKRAKEQKALAQQQQQKQKQIDRKAVEVKEDERKAISSEAKENVAPPGQTQTKAIITSEASTAGGQGKQKRANNPLLISTQRLLFGCVPLKDALQLKETIRNTTQDEIAVSVSIPSTSNRSGFKATVNGLDRAILKANESASLEVTFAPTIRGRSQSFAIINAMPQNFNYRLPLFGWGDVARVEAVCNDELYMSRSGEYTMRTSNFTRLSFELKNPCYRDAYAVVQVFWNGVNTPIDAVIIPAEKIRIPGNSSQEIIVRMPTNLPILNMERPDSAFSSRSSINSAGRPVSSLTSNLDNSTSSTATLRPSPNVCTIRVIWGEELLRMRLKELIAKTSSLEEQEEYTFNGITFAGTFFNEDKAAADRCVCWWPVLRDDWRMFRLGIRILNIMVRPIRAASSLHQDQLRSHTYRTRDDLTVHVALDPEMTQTGSPRSMMQTLVQEDVTLRMQRSTLRDAMTSIRDREGRQVTNANEQRPAHRGKRNE